MLNKLPKQKRVVRQLIWKLVYTRFSKDPFKIKNKPIPQDYYLQLAEKAKKNIPQNFLNEIKDNFKNILQNDFVNELALSTQIVKKKSELQYGHGYLLYSALYKYVQDNPDQNYTILETGTARGFSAVMMAKALYDNKSCGKVITVDVLPNNVSIYWNCIHDNEGKKTRLEILEKWKELVQNYIIFLQGYSDFVLKQLDISRIHFAFIDGSHEYEDVKNDAEFIIKRQKKGDIIIFDDYSPDKFIGVVKFVDEITDNNIYSRKIFFSETNRGYAYCVRN